MLSLCFLAVVVVLGAGYKFYGGWLEKELGIMEERRTPAHTMRDGVDYVPTPTPVVFGHHFSSIAGAGPIVGPIAAGLAFGWGPTLAWILLGVVFIGGVQDFTALVASLRNQGKGLAEIGRKYMGGLTYRMFLLFLLLTLVYIIIVFLDMTAATFAPLTLGWGGMDALPAADAARAGTGGTVAMASLATIAVAVVFGQLLHRGALGLKGATWVMVPLVFAALWLGRVLPLHAGWVPELWGSDKNFWSLALMGYCLLASVLPVWSLLQPRDYLASFLLYACLAFGVLGVGLSFLTGTGEIASPAWMGWTSEAQGPMYPMLFVLVACGAVSGFHALVASGTTSKQLDNEVAARPVGMGAMLVEALLAFLALATVMVMKRGGAVGAPPAIFAGGMEAFFRPFHLPEGLVEQFTLLAVSTFLLTTLDTCTRMSRMLLQELLGWKTQSLKGRVVATVVVLLPVTCVFGTLNGVPMWQAIWPAFGALNQLVAGLALLMVYSWLRGHGKKAWFVLAPTAFMLATSGAALWELTRKHWGTDGRLLSWICGALLVLAAVVLGDVARRLARRQEA